MIIAVDVDGADGVAAVVDSRYANGLDAVGGDSYTDDGIGPLDACSDGHRDAGGEWAPRKLVVVKCAADHWRWVHPCLVGDVAEAKVVVLDGFAVTETFAASSVVIHVPCRMVEEILT